MIKNNFCSVLSFLHLSWLVKIWLIFLTISVFSFTRRKMWINFQWFMSVAPRGKGPPVHLWKASFGPKATRLASSAPLIWWKYANDFVLMAVPLAEMCLWGISGRFIQVWGKHRRQVWSCKLSSIHYLGYILFNVEHRQAYI